MCGCPYQMDLIRLFLYSPLNYRDSSLIYGDNLPFSDRIWYNMYHTLKIMYNLSMLLLFHLSSYKSLHDLIEPHSLNYYYVHFSIPIAVFKDTENMHQWPFHIHTLYNGDFPKYIKNILYLLVHLDQLWLLDDHLH